MILYNVHIVILSLQLSVCDVYAQWEVTGSDLIQTKNFSFLDKRQVKIISISMLTFGSLMTIKEDDSEDVDIHRYFTEVGDSILGAFFCKPLRTKLQHEQQVSWLAD